MSIIIFINHKFLQRKDLEVLIILKSNKAQTITIPQTEEKLHLAMAFHNRLQLLTKVSKV
jgi:hypothetical protein